MTEVTHPQLLIHLAHDLQTLCQLLLQLGRHYPCARAVDMARERGCPK